MAQDGDSAHRAIHALKNATNKSIEEPKILQVSKPVWPTFQANFQSLLSDIHVQILSKDYCIESLLDNLKVEQPMQAYAPHNQPLINSTLFCAGYNVSYDFSADHFMRIHKNGLFRRMKATISDELRPYRINGGALCVGDSGGPLWVYNTGKKKMSTQKAVPVQMGVYSFMPWGTCSGAHETSFFGYIPQFLDWIFQYVPEEDVCKPWKLQWWNIIKASHFHLLYTVFLELSEDQKNVVDGRA